MSENEWKYNELLHAYDLINRFDTPDNQPTSYRIDPDTNQKVYNFQLPSH